MSGWPEGDLGLAVRRLAASLVLGLGLTLPTFLPEVSNIGFYFLAMAAVPLWSMGPERRAILSNPAIAVPLGAVVVLALTFPLATGSPIAPLGVFFVAPLVLVGSITAILRWEERTVAVATIAVFSSLGTFAAALVALNDRFVMGLSEPGASVNNPIHFASVALTLAFVCLVGLYDVRPWVRILSVAGFVAGILALWLSNARGPLVAFPAMLIVGVAVFVWQRLPSRLHLPALLVGSAGALLSAIVVWETRTLERFPALADIIRLVREGVITDRSTRERLEMYMGAFRAWQESPIVGHGAFDFVNKVADYAASELDYSVYQHLHSDIADFAVIGGLIGVLCYLCFLCAPILSAILAPNSVNSRVAIFLSTTVATGYFVMGLTNAMIGILTQTVLYSVICALVAYLSMPPRNVSSGAGRRSQAD